MNTRMAIGHLSSSGSQSPWVVVGAVCAAGALVITVLSLLLLPTAPVSVDHDFALPDTSDASIAQAIDRFGSHDPVADARRALESGDKRLLAAATLGWSIPGAPAENVQSYARMYGLRFMYTGCVVESDQESRFRSVADAYAERFNRTILQAIER